ncbi:MAG: redoxin domain-containing protein [Acidimicrobiia bacterium]
MIPATEVAQEQPEAADERRTRRLAVLTLVGLVAAGIALYAWIQTSSPSPPPAVSGPLFSTLVPGESGGPASGDQAPLFVVETFDGETFSLAEHLATDGRPLFLNLWASWCIPCREEMPAIDAASQRHPGVRFLGVAVRDDLGPAKDLGRETGVSYALAFDADGVVDAEYPILGMPATFYISPEGLILKRVYGQLVEDQIDGDVGGLFGG